MQTLAENKAEQMKKSICARLDFTGGSLPFTT